MIPGFEEGLIGLKSGDKKDLNLTAGRSVACVDRKGAGTYGIYVANYGGPTRFYEYSDDVIIRIPDVTKAMNELGFKPTKKVKESVEACLPVLS